MWVERQMDRMEGWGWRQEDEEVRTEAVQWGWRWAGERGSKTDKGRVTEPFEASYRQHFTPKYLSVHFMKETSFIS